MLGSARSRARSYFRDARQGCRMNLTERKSGDVAKLRQLIRKHRDAEQRDRYRVVLLAIQGREAIDIADAVARSRRFVQRWAYAYRDGGIAAVATKPRPGRASFLTESQRRSLVERVERGATAADAVSVLRGTDSQSGSNRSSERRIRSAVSITCCTRWATSRYRLDLAIRRTIPRRESGSGRAPPFCQATEARASRQADPCALRGRGAARSARHTGKRVAKCVAKCVGKRVGATRIASDG